MRKRFFSGRARAVVTGAAVALAALVGSTPSAHADPGCSVAGCSSSVNDSSFGAVAYFNWCRAGDSSGSWTTTRPTCSSGGAAQKTYYLLSGGGHTPYSEDWDAFQVDAGWCYRVRFIVDLAPDFTRTYDRRGQSAVWVKAEDNADAHIQVQSTGSAC